MNCAKPLFVAVVAIGITLAGCSTSGGNITPVSRAPLANCGSPPPVPDPMLWLAYPEPNATGVSTSVGELIFSGFYADYFAPISIALSSAGGNIAVGTLAAAPSPLPSPYATPPPPNANLGFIAAPIPTLSPATAYTISWTYVVWDSTPPNCRGSLTRVLGTFTTQ